MEPSKIFDAVKGIASRIGGIHQIILHPRPHFDEKVAVCLLRRFPYLKGIDSAFVTTQDVGNSRTLFWKYLKKGKLLVGQGGGPLDEHNLDGSRNGNESATLLVARLYDLDYNHDGIRDLVQAVTFEDANGHLSSPIHLPLLWKRVPDYQDSMDMDPDEWVSIAVEAYCDSPKRVKIRVTGEDKEWYKKELFKYYGLGDDSSKAFKEIEYMVHEAIRKLEQSKTPLGLAHTASLIARTQGVETARNWTLQGLKLYIEKYYAFSQAATYLSNGNYESLVEIRKGDDTILTVGKGEPLHIATVFKNGNPEISKAAMSPKGLNASIVIIRNPSGNVQILTRKKSNLDKRVLRRIGEGLQSVEPNVWFVPFDGMYLNGSLSHPDVTPTNLTDSEIHEIIAESFLSFAS